MDLGSQARTTTVTALLLLSLTVVASVEAQRAPAQDGARTGWLPRDVSFSNVPAAQRAAVMARLEQVERILLRIPALARPQGFEIGPVYVAGPRQHGPFQREQPGNVIEYGLRLMVFSPSRVVAGEGITCVSVTINPRAPIPSNSIRDQRGRDIYIEAERGDPLPLATQVYGKLLDSRTDRSGVTVLMTSGGEIPWLPVSREEYYRAMILDVEGKDGEKLAETRQAFAKTPYEEWMEGAATRKQDREATLQALVGMKTKAEIDEVRRTLEESERKVTEQLKAADGQSRERNTRALASASGPGDKMRAELEAMTPAERAMPAMIDGTLSVGPNATGWRMTSSDAPPATWRVLTPSYDFWRARRSPVEVRSISVVLSSTLGCLRPAPYEAVRQTWNALDWGALNRMLDAPR